MRSETLRHACTWFVELHGDDTLRRYGSANRDVLRFFPADRFTAYLCREDEQAFSTARRRGAGGALFHGVRACRVAPTEFRAERSWEKAEVRRPCARQASRPVALCRLGRTGTGVADNNGSSGRSRASLTTTGSKSASGTEDCRSGSGRRGGRLLQQAIDPFKAPSLHPRAARAARRRRGSRRERRRRCRDRIPSQRGGLG